MTRGITYNSLTIILAGIALNMHFYYKNHVKKPHPWLSLNFNTTADADCRNQCSFIRSLPYVN